MDPITRWEAAAMRGATGRPRPGTGEPVIDLRSSWSTTPTPTPEPKAEPAPDTLLVPIDAWNRMLSQLGNLHEAGRDLSEARERAARAETEAEFLRERVRELRDRLAAAEAPAAAAPEDDAPSDVTDSGGDTLRGAMARPAAAARSTYSRWRARRLPRR